MKRERYSIIYSSKTGNTKKLAEENIQYDNPEYISNQVRFINVKKIN